MREVPTTGMMALVLDDAETYIRRALEIQPDYPAAQHDLELIEEQRRQRTLD